MHPSSLLNCSAFFNAYSDSICQSSDIPRVLELGSQNINGSIRECCPSSFEYIGVDFAQGNGVDVVLADPYLLPFPNESFDIVVTNSCLEHSEMFWLIYLEMLRVLSPSGLLYINAPSNGEFHQYPLDCWRFYPDCGLALVSWAKHNNLCPALLESYTSYQVRDQWNDFVAIFIKDEANVSAHPRRILDSGLHFMNGRLYGNKDIINRTTHPEDRQFPVLIKQTPVGARKDDTFPAATHTNAIKMHLVKVQHRLKRFWKADVVSQPDSIRPPALLDKKSLKHLRSIKRYSPGAITTRDGTKINYSDACTLVAGHAEIFLDHVYDFTPTNSKPIILDCGANIGLASIWFALRFPEARIIAYEADPDIFEHLEKNISSLGLGYRVSARNLALWKDSDGVSFDQEGGFSGQVSGHAHELVKQSVKVPSVSLSEAISKFSKIDLLKIDIEGAENQIFLDEVDLHSVDRLFLEYHSHQSDPQELDVILGILSQNGFRYHIREAHPSSHPFVKIDTLLGMDLQLNIYCYRL